MAMTIWINEQKINKNGSTIRQYDIRFGCINSSSGTTPVVFYCNGRFSNKMDQQNYNSCLKTKHREAVSPIERTECVTKQKRKEIVSINTISVVP